MRFGETCCLCSKRKRRTLARWLRQRCPACAIQEVAELAFIERVENMVLLGPLGVGKTHIASAEATRSRPQLLVQCS